MNPHPNKKQEQKLMDSQPADDYARAREALSVASQQP
jgi:hypothetical protein